MRVKELLEHMTEGPPLRKDLQHTLSPTYIMPKLKNHDTYSQYRHNIALAAALAVKRGESNYHEASTFNQNQTTVCYTPQEKEILDLANDMVQVYDKKVSGTPSQEPDWVQKTSPVARFKDIIK
jgi:hypothetical protein